MNNAFIQAVKPENIFSWTAQFAGSFRFPEKGIDFHMGRHDVPFHAGQFETQGHGLTIPVFIAIFEFAAGQCGKVTITGTIDAYFCGNILNKVKRTATPHTLPEV